MPMIDEKVSIDLDKNAWHPSVLPGQIVIVSTINRNGEVDIAPKSWITMVAFAGPVLAFGCSKRHTTYRNILETGAFVVNIPGEGLAERIFSMIAHHGGERLHQTGFSLEPSRTVGPPSIGECSAHLECSFDGTKEYGEEVLIFGKIVAASVARRCQARSQEEQYFALRPVFFLENGLYASIDASKQVGQRTPLKHNLFVVELVSDGSEAKPVVDSHVAFLRSLMAGGHLLMAGPFSTAPHETGPQPSGMYVISADTIEEAERTAKEDPFVRAGASYRIRRWTRTF
jgi:flavin reductase (DIM6/NTAB) family NADH-FMN oxidoreductase RutF/uncharacterized protein YciI